MKNSNNPSNTFIGCDPGRNGVVSFLELEGNTLYHLDCFALPYNGKTVDVKRLNESLVKIKTAKAYIEHPILMSKRRGELNKIYNAGKVSGAIELVCESTTYYPVSWISYFKNKFSILTKATKISNEVLTKYGYYESSALIGVQAENPYGILSIADVQDSICICLYGLIMDGFEITHVKSKEVGHISP